MSVTHFTNLRGRSVYLKVVFRCCDIDEKMILIWILFWVSYSDFSPKEMTL